MNPKRCFHFTSCSLESRCELAYVDIKNGQFQPEFTGDNCHNFTPLIGDAKEHLPWGEGKDQADE